MLIDSGSELSLITEELVTSLQLSRTRASIPLVGIGGTYSGRTRGQVVIQIGSIHDSAVKYHLHAFILPRITFKLPTFTLRSTSWDHLNGLQLADPEFGKPKPIHLILGADAYGRIVKPDIIQGGPSSPVAQSTIFGWIVSGPVGTEGSTLTAGIYHCAVDHRLQEILTRFWEQEELSHASHTTLNPEETKCEAHFIATHSRNSNGRYVVRLPLKAPASALGNSSFKALRCMASLQRRFEKEPAYHQLYTDFMHEYQTLGHMVPVPATETNNQPGFYLPHHGVYREHSRTTKLRVVFNGSSRTDNGTSVNDILYPGAKLQSEIFDVLLWFRQHRYVFSTDIVKMYRQITVHEEDRDLQRIFWYDKTQQPRPYRLTTVTYGLNCAPFLALRVLKQLVMDEGHRFPKAIASLTRGRYVDDIFGGADSMEETVDIIRQLTALCMAGGFPLQKWNSNCQEILSQFPETQNDDASAVPLNTTEIKVLGLSWHPNSDKLQFTSWPTASHVITKRTILSEIAHLYDPLGLIAPMVIRAKLLLQELWLAKVEWDEPLSIELESRWTIFRQDLPSLCRLTISRWLGLSPIAKKIELHGFSDASQLAMAAVMYLKVKPEKGQPTVTLICAKTKVAPLKRMTIPRLELTAALMLSKLFAKTQRALNIPECPTSLWTDSAVALTWITTHPSRWKEFIRNRTTSIQETAPSATWRFVPGKENPADCASRGVDGAQLREHPLWWTGPSWLRLPAHQWPTNSLPTVSDLDREEAPRRVMTVTNVATPTYWDLLTRYSSLSKLLKITARCQQVAARFHTKSAPLLDSPLTPSDMKQSCQFWIQHVQRAYFHEEIKAIISGKQLPKSNPLLRLTPYLDSSGLLRVGGRVENSQLDPEAKHPYIIPRHSPLTSLIIADAHLQTLHGGTQITLAYTRQTYWILGGRAPVRSFILRCVRCARHRGQRAQQLMGQLPRARVTPSRPFLNAGVDYAGPINIKTWRGRAAKVYKGYLAVFVCFATSAVHLEVVTDYTTDAFLAAYKRFTSRRGICSALHSDCGTNFVGADAELRKLFSSASKELKDLAALLTNCGTEWKFIPPAAPHFGGIWEAAVKSTKFHLRRIIGDAILTYEELSTLLTQIEAILNSRPICPLSNDSNDFSVLTPGHFLIGEALTTVPEPSLLQEPLSRLNRWQLIRQKTEIFWKRWTTECLQRYQAISKWHHPSNELREGSLVLITDERYPPTKWPLARVEELHPGPDGLTRVATVRTQTTSLKRPVTKLCILPTKPERQTFGNGASEGGRENV